MIILRSLTCHSEMEQRYVLDRAYLCFKTLQNINKPGAFFVTRTKTNTKYRVIKKNKPTAKTILRDNIISFTGLKSDDYSAPLAWFNLKILRTAKSMSSLRIIWICLRSLLRRYINHAGTLNSFSNG